MSEFKKGDKVVMHSCGESTFPKYKGKIWICEDNCYISSSGTELVFLNGFSGSFLTKYLQIVKVDELTPKLLEVLEKLVEWYGEREDSPSEMNPHQVLKKIEDQPEEIQMAMQAIKQATTI